MKKQTNVPAPAANPSPLAITSLSQLEQLSNGAPVIVNVRLRGQLVQFTGRRLKPAESKEIKILLESALPPILPPDKEGQSARYDYRNPGYLRAVEENKRKARALALHAAYPIFSEALAATGRPVDENRIADFIESRDLDDDVLEVLFNAVTGRVVDAAAMGFS